MPASGQPVDDWRIDTTCYERPLSRLKDDVGPLKRVAPDAQMAILAEAQRPSAAFGLLGIQHGI
jgi:hypothetical protein